MGKFRRIKIEWNKLGGWIVLLMMIFTIQPLSLSYLLYNSRLLFPSHFFHSVMSDVIIQHIIKTSSKIPFLNFCFEWGKYQPHHCRCCRHCCLFFFFDSSFLLKLLCFIMPACINKFLALIRDMIDEIICHFGWTEFFGDRNDERENLGMRKLRMKSFCGGKWDFVHFGCYLMSWWHWGFCTVIIVYTTN